MRISARPTARPTCPPPLPQACSHAPVSLLAEEEVDAYKRPPNSEGYLRGLVWLMHMYLQGEWGEASLAHAHVDMYLQGEGRKKGKWGGTCTCT